MAVAPNRPQFVKDFWPRLKRDAATTIIILQLTVAGSLGTLFYFLGAYETAPFLAITILVSQLILGTVVSFVIFHFIATPLQSILAAITHIAGEPTTTAPPNPSEGQYEKSGLRPVLQTLYQVSSQSPVTKAEPTTNQGPGQRSPIEAALDATLCGFVAYTKERTIAYANKATPLRVDTNGTKSLDLIFNEADSLETWWDECEKNEVHAEKTWSRISNKLPNEENRRFFDVIASYSKGAPNEVVLTLIDRTHLYSIGEEELDFIAFAAHELRGPITVIRGYLDVLQDELSDTLQPDQKELFRRLTVSANRLSGYINNILNTSRYDRRHLKMHLTETSLKEVFASIQDDMQLRASSQGRLLTITIPDGLPTIGADTASLGEVFGNLIDNAIKYSNEGGAVTVTASSKGDSIEVAVTDHGIGMPANVVSNLFQKFYRSHRSRETVAGTGIGLYISKAIVESHGGSISVQSEDGRGSTFTVSLPTYQMVADKLKAGNNGNETLIGSEGSWIKNHTMYRG